MSYRGVVLDLDGTVYRGTEALPGAAGTIETLRDAGLALRFVSNNPTHSRAEYVERLGEMGIEVDPEEVFSAGTVTTEYLTAEHETDRLYLIGSRSLEAQFEAAGLTLVDDPTAADVLVASWDGEFDYGSLTAGLHALQDERTTFIGSDPDTVVPSGGGRLIPGSGAIIGALEVVSDRAPDRVLGKPSPEAVAALDASTASPLSEWLLVGDRLDTDIAFGQRAGMTTVLVLTGVSDRDTLATSEYTPDHVLDSLAELPTLLAGQ